MGNQWLAGFGTAMALFIVLPFFIYGMISAMKEISKRINNEV